MYTKFGDSMSNNVGDYIRIKSEKLRMSNKEIAEKSGLTEDYIRKIKRGVPKDYSLSTLTRLAIAFGMSLREFLEETSLIQQEFNDDSFTDEEVENFIKVFSIWNEKLGFDPTQLDLNQKLEFMSYHLSFWKLLKHKYKEY